MRRWNKEVEQTAEETPDRSRLRFLLNFGALAALLIVGCGRIPVGPEEDQPVNELDETTAASDRIPSIIRKSLRRILNEEQPGWQAWEDYPNYGIGIWSVPGLVDNGLCWIYVNGILICNNTANIDGIILRSGDVLTLTETRQNGQVLWTYEVPYPNRYCRAS